MLTPGKHTLGARVYEDTRAKRSAERWVVIHKWERLSDRTEFVDYHRFATEVEARQVCNTITGYAIG